MNNTTTTTVPQADDLPKFERLDDYIDNPPQQPPEIIAGVLRQGHKMIISGASKAGKSFLLMELAIAVAEDREWLGFPCRQGRVLYLNLEIDRASCIVRFLDIYKALGLSPQCASNIQIWNLRGHALPADELVDKLIHRLKDAPVDLVIIDPIYKIITGDENNATEMAHFTNQFDRICTEIGCAVVYAHHHSKGGQGSKRSMDRASGSGVFARDPDAILDIIQLQPTDDQIKHRPSDTATAWRLEGNLREFPDIQPIEFWFDHPIHYLDDSGILQDAPANGSARANLAKSSKRTTVEQRRKTLDDAYNACADQPVVRIKDMAKYAKMSTTTIREYIENGNGDYQNSRGIVTRKNPSKT